MDVLDVYKIGARLPKFNYKSLDDKLKFVLFQYDGSSVLWTSAIVFLAFTVSGALLAPILPFFFYTGLFFGGILGSALYIYPSGIYYTHSIMRYREEMLQCIMKLSTMVSLNTSMEYALYSAKDELHGILKLQIEDIFLMLHTRQASSLEEAMGRYMGVWNEINPEFVKGLNLLTTASASEEEEKNEIIKEVLETIIRSYHLSGKRFAEQLAGRAKLLIGGGVLLPVISLMILPLISVFLPDLVTISMLVFLYNIVFPAGLLLAALNFSSSRVQVNTIHIEESPQYKPIPGIHYAIAFGMITILAIPALLHLSSINMNTIETAAREYAVMSIVSVVLLPLGLVLAIWYLTSTYVKKYKPIWEDVYEVENSFPHLLQIFATYLRLNRSIESIIPEVVDEYEVHKSKNHPVARIFRQLLKKMRVTKSTVADLAKNIVPKLCPSRRVTDTLLQIIGYTYISQKGSARAAKMIRKQNLSIYDLDDYIRSLLAETVSLIGVVAMFLAPLLSATAVIMSLAIVMSLSYITNQLEVITSALGSAGDPIEFVDVSAVIPPTITLVIVSIFLIEIVLILSVFLANIKVGTDHYTMMKTVYQNILIGFVLFTIMLVAGFIGFVEIVFAGALGV
ncbi:MAG: hypothetical protein ACMXYF_05280 [Candidatus Woesearchaeota archaeon]